MCKRLACRGLFSYPLNKSAVCFAVFYGENNMNVSSKMFLFVLILSFNGILFAGGTKEHVTKTEKPIIAVSILPQEYFVKRIGGERVETLVLVGPGQSPHSYEPSPRQIASLSKAAVWILSGTEFEITLEKKIAAQFPKLKIIDGTKGVKFRMLEDHGDHEGHIEGDDNEGHDDGDVEGSIDRHTWLGHENAIILATHVRDALFEADPAAKNMYETEYSALILEINTEFGQLKSDLAFLSGRTVLVFHPSFGYFLDEFNIIQESVETGGKEPTAKALSGLIARAKQDKTPAIFVQAQFPVTAAETVAKGVGARVVYLDPLSSEWLLNIKQMGSELKKTLELGR